MFPSWKTGRKERRNMVARCYSGTINGVDASTVEIEVSSSKGTSSFAIVGLPDTAVKEAKDRVSTALRNSGFRTKDEYAVTVNLAPADVRKEGPIYDLPPRPARLCRIYHSHCYKRYQDVIFCLLQVYLNRLKI